MNRTQYLLQASLTGFALLCLLGALAISIITTIARRKEEPDLAAERPTTMPVEWLRRQTGITDPRFTAEELEGIRRYREGQPLHYSTGVHDGLTWGYGEIDMNGYWQYPVPFEVLDAEHRNTIRDAERRTPALAS